jgi:hypothetical protein
MFARSTRGENIMLRLCLPLRQVPPGTNFEPLILAARGAGIELNTASSRGLALSLEEVCLATRILGPIYPLPSRVFGAPFIFGVRYLRTRVFIGLF